MSQQKQIQFIIYSEENIAKLCDIIYRLYRKKLSVLVLFDTIEESYILEEALWTYNIQKFIPHHIFNSDNTMLAPVTLAEIANSKSLNNFQVLINFSGNIPEYYKSFKEIHEMVLPIEAKKIISREHYKFYKNHNYIINTVNLQDITDVTDSEYA